MLAEKIWEIVCILILPITVVLAIIIGELIK